MLLFSFILTVAIYSFIFKSFWLALVVFGLLGVHEAGHVIAMNQKGIGVRKVFFIPFMGAVAIPLNRMWAEEEEWAVALAGPLAGMIGSFVCFAAGSMTESVILMKAAKISAYINIFNMVPIYPLDGGRVFKALWGSLWPGETRVTLVVVGGALSIWIAFRTGVFMLPFIAYLGWKELKTNRDMRPMRVGKVALGMLSAVAVFFSLLVLMYLTRDVKAF